MTAKTTRRFRIAPPLARLLAREHGASRRVEAYFETKADRNSHVLVDDEGSFLVLVTEDGEDVVEVPQAHASALLDVANGQAVMDRTVLGGGIMTLSLERYVAPADVDIVSVTFTSPGEAGSFKPPAWLAEEVTDTAAFSTRGLALQGSPGAAPVEVTNASLDALLDHLEGRRSAAVIPFPNEDAVRPPAEAAAPANDSWEPVLDAQIEEAFSEAPPPALPQPTPSEAILGAPEHAESGQEERADDLIAGLSKLLSEENFAGKGFFKVDVDEDAKNAKNPKNPRSRAGA